MVENKLEPVLPVITPDNGRSARAPLEEAPEPERVAAKAKH